MDQLGESIRKLILAGIGAAAVTREKGESVLRDLVKKGELTVEQGKVLNEELKRNVKEAIRDNVTVHVVTPSDDLMSAVDDMDDESLAALKERIRAAEEARKAAPAAEKADEAEKPCCCGQAGDAEKAPAEKCACGGAADFRRADRERHGLDGRLFVVRSRVLRAGGRAAGVGVRGA